MNGKNLDAINNARIHRLMSKLLGYSFKVEWIAEKNHCIADALSRSPVFQAEDHADILICKVFEAVLDPALKQLSDHAKADVDYQKVVDALSNWKNLKNLPEDHPAQSYKSQWDVRGYVRIPTLPWPRHRSKGRKGANPRLAPPTTHG